MVKKNSKPPKNKNPKTKTSTSSKSQARSVSPKTRMPIIMAIILLVLFGLGYFIGSLIGKSKSADYIVETSGFFAPFEYYKEGEIVGVDRDIVDAAAAYMNKTIALKDVEFDVIVDNVASGKIADAGAAGLTITPARSEKVNFSIPYYTSIQYIVYDASRTPELRGDHITWEALADSSIGSQTGATGYLFAQSEIEEGVLVNKNVELKGFDNHQLAADAISAGILDYAIVDELPAQFIITKNPNLAAVPLYYSADSVEEDSPVEESYAIAVNKNQKDLLDAFNAVLTEMLAKDESGVSTIDRLVLKHMGFDE